MFFHLIINQVTKSRCHQVTVTAFLFFLFVFQSLSATVSASDFTAATPGIHSPQIEVRLSSLPDEATALDRKVSTFKNYGFGGIVVTSVPTGSNSWKRIALIAQRCRKYSMKLGCDFFPQDDNTDILYNIVWTNRIVKAGGHSGNTDNSAFVRGKEHIISQLLIPLSFSNHISRAFSHGYKKPAPDDDCFEYTFKAVPVNPLAVNYLDGAVFESSVNKFLLNAQLRLRNNYGTVFDTVRFPSVSNTLSVWARNLPAWFKKDMDFDLAHNLPGVLFAPTMDDLSKNNVRYRYERSLQRLWRESFTDKVQPLVHEAGLNAAISANEIPLPPEELGAFFQYPVAVGTTNARQRAVNRRMPGGINIYSSSPVIGRIQMNKSAPRSLVDALFVDGATRIIFSENTEGFLFGEEELDSLRDLCVYVNRCSNLLQNSEPALGIFLVSESVPPSLHRFTFDSVTPRMLKDAEIKDEKIFFISGRKSSFIVFSDDIMRRNKLLIKDLEASGVKALPVSGIESLIPDFNWKSEDENLKLRFTRRTSLSSELFLIKNESDCSSTAELIFKIKGVKKVARWQPQDGKITQINKFTQISPSQCMITTPVRANELFFIVFDY